MAGEPEVFTVPADKCLAFFAVDIQLVFASFAVADHTATRGMAANILLNRPEIVGNKSMAETKQDGCFRLFGAKRSAASYRVRIALQLKGMAFEETYIDLASGEHQRQDYRAINPQGFVPALALPDGGIISQSLAIIDYLEEIQPDPALLPGDPAGRARARSLAQIIACDMHPVNNMRIRNYVRDLVPADPLAVPRWLETWSAAGFETLETRLQQEPETGRFCHGDTPGLADICLVPQVFNAGLTGIDLQPYARIRQIAGACAVLPAFQAAHPDHI
jgi:maleylpyruvate isomerase